MGLAQLLDEEQKVLPHLARTMDMAQIESFAARLAGWAQVAHFPALAGYAATLQEQVEAFDVDGLPRTLRDFPEVRGRIVEST